MIGVWSEAPGATIRLNSWLRVWFSGIRDGGALCPLWRFARVIGFEEI